MNRIISAFMLVFLIGCDRDTPISVTSQTIQKRQTNEAAMRYLDPNQFGTTELNDSIYLVATNVFTGLIDTLKMNIIFPDPDTASNRWAIVFAPGGGDGRAVHHIFREDMAKRGYVVFSYDRQQNPTIFPGSPNPTAWQIQKSANAATLISLLRSRLAEYGIATDRIITSGSAGGAVSGAGAAYLARLDTAGLIISNGESHKPDLVTGVSYALNANTLPPSNPFPGYPFNYNSEIEFGEAPIAFYTASGSFRVQNTISTYFFSKDIAQIETKVKVRFGSKDHGIPNLGEVNSAIEISKLIYDYFNGNW